MQSATTDEFVYHESLVHTAMMSHPNPKRVFIGGGGEGATLREVLRHKSVEKCVMVDIDEQAVSATRQHMPLHSAGAFDDPRTELVIDDAKAWLERYKGPAFDIMIMDLADPTDEGPCYLLYTAKFYAFCRTLLTENGVFVTQAGPSGLYTSDQVCAPIWKTLGTVFASVQLMVAHVPSYSDIYGFAVCGVVPLASVGGRVDQLLKERLFDVTKLRHLDEETYKHMASLPKYLRDRLAAETRIITEESPLYIPD
jgi:thermospermine synthase